MKVIKSFFLLLTIWSPISSSSWCVDLHILTRLEMNNGLSSKIHFLQLTPLVELEDVVLAFLACMTSSHSVRTIHSSIAENAELEVGPGLNLSSDAVATTPSALASASVSDAVLANENCCSLLYHFAVCLSSICRVNLSTVSNVF